MLSAAVCPWRSATTQCSTRIRWPVCGSGQRAMSPAAKTPGALVSRYSLTEMPRSIVRPACSASPIAGRTPIPTTMKSASRVDPPLSMAVEPGNRLAKVELHPVLFVQPLDEPSHFGAHHLFERHVLGRDDVNVDASC